MNLEVLWTTLSDHVSWVHYEGELEPTSANNFLARSTQVRIELKLDSVVSLIVLLCFLNIDIPRLKLFDDLTIDLECQSERVSFQEIVVFGHLRD